jgi:hypothetical protein
VQLILRTRPQGGSAGSGQSKEEVVDKLCEELLAKVRATQTPFSAPFSTSVSAVALYMSLSVAAIFRPSFCGWPLSNPDAAAESPTMRNSGLCYHGCTFSLTRGIGPVLHLQYNQPNVLIASVLSTKVGMPMLLFQVRIMNHHW